MALDGTSSRRAHALQNLGLIYLNVFLLPITTLLVLFSILLNFFHTSEAEKARQNARSQSRSLFQPKRILVTGVGMSKGLAIARLFYIAGHDVVGADFDSCAFLCAAPGRVSKSLKNFYRLVKPTADGIGAKDYALKLVDIINQEKIDIWVSCSGVASALDDGLAKEVVENLTTCKAVQFDVDATRRLHEKHNFMEYTKSLNLTIPESHTITSSSQASDILEKAQDKQIRYVLKYIGTDDTVRGDMTLLPLKTNALTTAHLSKLKISEDRPWILQQYIKGPEFCTHSVVIKGKVKAFVACPSAELLMHYQALPSRSALSQSMLRFTQEIAAAGGKSFTGHLSFDFLVETKEVEAANNDPSRVVKLYPIECNPRAHTAVVLFNNTPGVADVYLSLLRSQPEQGEDQKALTNGVGGQPLYPSQSKDYFWIGNDIIVDLLLPLAGILKRDGSTFAEALKHTLTCVMRVIFWKDGTYEAWDPWPIWWLYHVYWPIQFLIALVFGRKWSRINVSTCKMFMC